MATTTETTTTSAAAAAEMRLPLTDIVTGNSGNVRDALDNEHVETLMRSIALRGVLVPLIVRAGPDGRFHLVAGAHRAEACRRLGHTDVPVVVRQHEGSTGDAAAENVVRKALTPLEEARAVQAMLDDGYTLDGAAQALGWSPQLTAARAKVLKLPPLGQQLIGDGRIPVSAVDTALKIHATAPGIADALLASVDADADTGVSLARDPGRTVANVLWGRPKGVFGEPLHAFTQGSVKPLKLGKKLTDMMEEATKLEREINGNTWGRPTFRFAEADIDRARAAGVLLEFADYNGPPIITDRALYRELVKDVITRTVEDLRGRAADHAAQAKKAKKKTGSAPDPRGDLEREHRAASRGFAERAHGVNLDLGVALLNDLATVDPTSLDVARFFCYGLLGPDGGGGGYSPVYENVARKIAASGLALVLEEHRVTTTKTLKSGQPGKTKVAYAEDATGALWRFVDAASTASELFGRTIVVYAAQHYALQMVLPPARRRTSGLPESHKDHARKAFERLTKPVLPATWRQLRRAIDAEARQHTRNLDALTGRGRGRSAPDPQAPADEDLDDFDDAEA